VPNTDFFGNPRPQGTGYDIGAVEFGAAFNTPNLANITPNNGIGTVSVTLIGSDLTGATAVNVSGSGVTVSFTVVSDSEISATFSIASGAAIGARNVTVTTPNGTTNPVQFTVGQAVVAFTGPVPVMSAADTSIKNAVITLQNTGNGPLTLSSTVPTSIANVSGTGTGTASIQPGGSCTLGAVVNPAGSCTINVRWVPTNTLTANLAVTVTDTGAATATQTSATFPAN
jgi:hypothetical protein